MNTTYFSGLEDNLLYSLTPIDPDPDFIHHLGTRLRKKPSISIERSYNHLFSAVTIGVGLVTGAFLVWGLKKAFTLIRS